MAVNQSENRVDILTPDLCGVLAHLHHITLPFYGRPHKFEKSQFSVRVPFFSENASDVLWHSVTMDGSDYRVSNYSEESCFVASAHTQYTQVHAEGMPAVSFDSGGLGLEDWRYLGDCHRVGGPAYQAYTPESRLEIWAIHGVLHREDGPALTYKGPTGTIQIWYVGGDRIKTEGSILKEEPTLFQEGVTTKFVKDQTHLHYQLFSNDTEAYSLFLSATELKEYRKGVLNTHLVQEGPSVRSVLTTGSLGLILSVVEAQSLGAYWRDFGRHSKWGGEPILSGTPEDFHTFQYEVDTYKRRAWFKQPFDVTAPVKRFHYGMWNGKIHTASFSILLEGKDSRNYDRTLETATKTEVVIVREGREVTPDRALSVKPLENDKNLMGLLLKTL